MSLDASSCSIFGLVNFMAVELHNLNDMNAEMQDWSRLAG
jgi:hypothetical protein